ncbi:hypothetical protein CQW49_06475 [Methylosinus trichosporium OB3b]|uniref:Ubiquitin 3 binding protein But2 C-terminal domain-containing protein n=1 Tax=Methylosinus trichosporium (strain ATCC 35070 / NCIMB 11131 / UNIQEM 75 / OB3b) TaxID=595536 RepID=A0A2D2CXU4_METT3|nr:hypothetical protein CQW49_06475 [Methylosinus trichosporium OB3b]OBS52115.1 hypothetical protein A8B73_12415 [Methylosinus sp. 3S-1]
MSNRRASFFVTSGALLVAFAAHAGPDLALPPGVVWPPAPEQRPPAGAIPGYYDPATKTFQPLAATPAAAKTYSVTFVVPLSFTFKNSSATDWGSINCQATISYRAPDNSISRADAGSEGFDAFSTQPQITSKQRITTTSEANPRGVVTVQCTAYDDNGRGYSTRQVKSFTIVNGVVTTPFTFNMP